MTRTLRRRVGYAALLIAAVAGTAACLRLDRSSGSGPRLPADPALAQHVHASPPVPVVFTSRTTPNSFQPWADDSEGFTYPGAVSWTASEGRLRLLDTDSSVTELTWGRPLPDGGTLIDVMSPTVSLDGKRILFAGRKAAPNAGRWRIYSVGVDGSDLKQLTGIDADTGCVAVPPMRFGADGGKLGEVERRRLDFDDVDPIDLGPGGFAFASSRLPDLGRDHSRRATQIWRWAADGDAPRPLTANRNNDRWPHLLPAGNLTFSSWSRTREAVLEDRTDYHPVADGGRFATATADRWMGGRVAVNGTQIGYAVKSAEPVWRPRPLFNGRMAFMTAAEEKGDRLRLAQAGWGYIGSAPSAVAAGDRLAPTGESRLHFGPTTDAAGRPLTAGCPSPCPDDRVLFAGRPIEAPATAFALYSVADDWSKTVPVPELLFDDPAFVDAEPVAVYARSLDDVANFLSPPPATADPPAVLRLADGTEYTGPKGFAENLAILAAIRSPIPWQSAEVAPGRRRDPRVRPLVPPPPSMTRLAAYADHRDRFDDPTVPRVRGKWEKLITVPVTAEGNGEVSAWLPANPLAPVKLVGLDSAGKVATWQGTEMGPDGKPATFFGVAGDHHSDFRPKGYHYCNGCHAGHTFTSLDIRERRK